MIKCPVLGAELRASGKSGDKEQGSMNDNEDKDQDRDKDKDKEW